MPSPITLDPMVFRTQLDVLGLPLFKCTPGRPGGDREVFHPKGWQKLPADGNTIRMREVPVDAITCAVLGDRVAVVDVDTKNGAAVEATLQWLKHHGVRVFAHVETPSGGAHLYVAGHSGLQTVHASGQRDGLVGMPGVEILSRGTNVFLPGTDRPKYQGTPYRILWNHLEDLADVHPAEGESLVHLVAEHRVPRPAAQTNMPPAPVRAGDIPNARQQQYLDRLVANVCAELALTQSGGRNNALNAGAYRLGRFVAGAGLEEEEAIKRLLRAAEQNGSLAEDGHAHCLATMRSGLRAGATKPAAVPEPDTEPGGENRLESPEGLDDAQMASWMARYALGGSWCWAGGLGWLRWDGTRWKHTTEAEVTDAVRQAVIDLYKFEASETSDPNQLAPFTNLLSFGRIKAITRLMRGVLAVQADQFDQQTDVLNVANGVVDLATGDLLPHDRDLLLTKVTPVPYVAGATHPDWAQALTALPTEVRDWMQVRFGQAATGHPAPDDVLPVLQGGGSNGKSTILAATRSALGQHAVQVPERVLTSNPSDHPTELMTLHGARLATIEETPQTAYLNVQRLKATVGTPTMTARRIRQDNVQWRTTHTLMLATNYRPRIDESDHGTWRRLALVRFPYTFPSSGLRERIEQNTDGQLEAVLAWIVDGARKWYAAQRVMPAKPVAVVDDTRAWRAEADRILAYVSERLEFDPSACVTTMDLFEDFNDWLRSGGHRVWSDQEFTDRFGQHSEVLAHQVEKVRTRALAGLIRRQPMAAVSSQASVWKGVRWRTEADIMDSERTDRIIA